MCQWSLVIIIIIYCVGKCKSPEREISSVVSHRFSFKESVYKLRMKFIIASLAIFHQLTGLWYNVLVTRVKND